MERDTIIGHGCAGFGKDRLFEQSDETRAWLCRVCGLPALVIDENIGSRTRAGTSSSSNIVKKENSKKECRVCESNDIVLVRMPYATKLLMQEFSGMNVIIRVLVTPHGNVASLYNGNKKIGESEIEIEKS